MLCLVLRSEHTLYEGEREKRTRLFTVAYGEGEGVSVNNSMCRDCKQEKRHTQRSMYDFTEVFSRIGAFIAQ
jgi:hypothetical protein